jgi:hypothetical protein
MKYEINCYFFPELFTSIFRFRFFWIAFQIGLVLRMIEGGYVQRPYAARFANAWLTGVTR